MPKPVIITCAPTGGIHTPTMSPHLPITPDQIVTASVEAAEAGASVIIVEANYDVGGHAMLSNGNVALGGGTSAQKQYGIEDSQ